MPTLLPYAALSLCRTTLRVCDKPQQLSETTKQQSHSGNELPYIALIFCRIPKQFFDKAKQFSDKAKLFPCIALLFCRMG